MFLHKVINHHSTLEQRVGRPRLEFRNQDFYNFSLNIKTETETENHEVSMSRPRLIETLEFGGYRDRDWAKVVET